MIKLKEGFKGQRLLSLPDEQLNQYAADSLIGALYVRKMGFFPKVQFHYMNKEQGTDYHMLIYCTAGRGWYVLAGERYEVKSNQYIIIPPNMPYSFGACDEDPWTIYFIHFRGTLAPCFLPHTYAPSTIVPGKNSRIQDRLDMFEEIFSNFALAFIKEYMMQTSMYLYPFLSSFLNVEQFRHFKIGTVKEQTFSMQVVHYMMENVGNKISLQNLAQTFHYSPSHFSALFLRETGVSPINYFIRLKIRKACEYIELTDMKLIDIAEKVGFDEAAYFCRIFSKLMGMSPSEYRRNEKKYL
jgi:AraC-like DNA-binding protein/mannose-6-phosphate isomerase-like protein (cupin superfamily)